MNKRISKKVKKLSGVIREHFDKPYSNLVLAIVEDKEYKWWQYLLYGWIILCWEVYDMSDGFDSRVLLATMSNVYPYSINWEEAGNAKRPEEVIEKEEKDREFNLKFCQKYPELNGGYFYHDSSF